MYMECHLSGYGTSPTCDSFSLSTRSRSNGKSRTQCQVSLADCFRPPDKDPSVRPISDISWFHVFVDVLYVCYP